MQQQLGQVLTQCAKTYGAKGWRRENPVKLRDVLIGLRRDFSIESSKRGSELAESFSSCAKLVRRHDYNGYLCTLALPKHLHPAAFAARAFNVESVQAIESTKEVAIARMRLAFWRDTMKDVYKGAPTSHPVARALQKVVEIAHPPKRWFDQIIDTRIEDLLRHAPYADMPSLEKYVEGTSASLLYIQLHAIGVQSTAADHAASHIGKAAGLATLLRGTAHLASRRQCYLPADLLMKHGVSQESVYRGEASEALAEVVFECATAAKAHLDHGRKLKSTVPNAAFPILLPSVQTELYLNALEKCNFNVFDASLAHGSRSDAMRQLHAQVSIGWYSWQGTY